MPFSGKTQQTPVQAMAAKLPVLNAKTDTTSIMAWGFDPAVSTQSPYHGAVCAVVESIAKVVAAGGTYEHCWLTFQEYFERTQGKPERWGKPFAALLGAYRAQLEMGCGAIGGKDSMSGTFEHIDVPPTLVSFAVSTAKAPDVISAEFKAAGIKVETDSRAEKIGYKIREARNERVPYIVVVGEKEAADNTLSVRCKGEDLGSYAVEDFIKEITEEIKNKTKRW